MTDKLKQHETIGCCGIDCGLCPRFHSNGDSACPGCGGSNFKEKHPSCGFVTCCVIKKKLEVCSLCNEFPCKRFDPEKNGYDSFVTHKKVFVNLNFVKSNGIDFFINQQKIRIDILKDFISKFDDGCSKSFFCLSCALLPVNKLQEIHQLFMAHNDSVLAKEQNRQLKARLQMEADKLDIVLKLNNKK